FNGCAIVVSHDRYFLDRAVEAIFAIESGGNLRQYPGNYSVYLEYKQAEEEEKSKVESQKSKAESRTPTPTPDSRLPTPASSRKLSFKEKREYETLENQIPEMEAQKEELEKIFYNNPPSDFTEMQQLSEQLAQLVQAIDTATERWLELAEREND
ncbi:MAG: ABC transporter ATP-binding protein, partial [Xenococcaceae cyanobacterium]